MTHVSSRLNTPVAIATHWWHQWKTACDRAVTHYYNQCIESDPEGEARRYWRQLKHPQSSVNVYDIDDAMLSRLMHSMLKQGVSKFAVDCFILELRRLTRLL
jgi:hypothetical protein